MGVFVKLKLLQSLLFVSLFQISTLQAALISTTGAIVQGLPPSDLDYGGTVSSDQILLFQEQSSFPLPSDVPVDMTAPTTATGGPFTTAGSISSGTIVDSYFMHLHAYVPEAVTLSGSMTFDQDILGIMLSDESLYATDPIFGVSGTTYPAFFDDNFRGTAEVDSANDIVTLSLDLRTITVTGYVFDYGIDQMRIITEVSPVPIPAAAWLFGTALFGLVGFTKRRKKA